MRKGRKERKEDAGKVLSHDKILSNAFKVCKFCFEQRNNDRYIQTIGQIYTGHEREREER